MVPKTAIEDPDGKIKIITSEYIRNVKNMSS